jgi:hypothetical protein
MICLIRWGEHVAPKRRRAFAADQRQAHPRLRAPSPSRHIGGGWVLAAVVEVLTAAGGPMQTHAIHAATQRLTGESVASSSIRNCLASGLGEKSPRFERVGHGRYRFTSHGRAPRVPVGPSNND